MAFICNHKIMKQSCFHSVFYILTYRLIRNVSSISYFLFSRQDLIIYSTREIDLFHLFEKKQNERIIIHIKLTLDVSS